MDERGRVKKTLVRESGREGVPGGVAYFVGRAAKPNKRESLD